MSEQLRITVSVDKDVHATFKRMAFLGGLSVSRCIGEWLADTQEAAQMVAGQMHDAKTAPTRVLNELLALSAHAHKDIMQLKQEGRAARADKPQADGRAAPPSSNTGVKGTRNRGKNA